MPSPSSAVPPNTEPGHDRALVLTLSRYFVQAGVLEFSLGTNQHLYYLYAPLSLSILILV